MDYKDNLRPDVDTPKIILKVNHAGEYGAISIYRAQIFFSKLFYKDLTPVLEEFLNDEKRHLDIFWNEIQARDGIKCKSVYLCGAGGFAMGAISSLLGRKGIMAVPGLSSR